MKSILFNTLLFQLGWFACVLSGAAKQPWIGVSIAVMIMAIHVMRATKRQNELTLIMVAMLIGTVLDSILVWQYWLSYPSGMFLENTAPYWIIVMWGLFATTLNVSLRWLKGNIIMSAVIGAIAGPLAYYGGYKLGAVQFIDTPMALIALSIGWTILTPALIYLSNKCDGYPPHLNRSPI